MDFSRALFVCGFVDCAAGVNIDRKICREFACPVQDSQEINRKICRKLACLVQDSPENFAAGCQITSV
jgi:hypothetical protein